MTMNSVRLVAAEKAVEEAVQAAEVSKQRTMAAFEKLRKAKRQLKQVAESSSYAEDSAERKKLAREAYHSLQKARKNLEEAALDANKALEYVADVKNRSLAK